MTDFKFGVPGPPGSPWGFPGGFASPARGEGPAATAAAASGAEKLSRVPGAAFDPLVRFTEIVRQAWNSLVENGQLVKRGTGDYEVVVADDGAGLTGDI